MVWKDKLIETRFEAKRGSLDFALVAKERHAFNLPKKFCLTYKQRLTLKL